MILVVDDEVEVCELITEYLGSEDKEVISAYNVPQALKAVKEKKFSAVICDLMLGTGKGESVLTYLRKKGSGHEKTPCLLISGVKSPENIALGTYDRFLSKPFSREEFLEALADLMGNEAEEVADRKSNQEKSALHPDLRKLLGS